jgi:hypothetical protein
VVHAARQLQASNPMDASDRKPVADLQDWRWRAGSRIRKVWLGKTEGRRVVAGFGRRLVVQGFGGTQPAGRPAGPRALAIIMMCSSCR